MLRPSCHHDFGFAQVGNLEDSLLHAGTIEKIHQAALSTSFGIARRLCRRSYWEIVRRASRTFRPTPRTCQIRKLTADSSFPRAHLSSVASLCAFSYTLVWLPSVPLWGLPLNEE